MIIDSHVHVGRSDKISITLTFTQLKKTMNEYNIFQSVVMPNISGEDSCIERNNIMLKEISDMRPDDKDYYIPYAWIDLNQDGYIEHLESIKDKIHGVKYHPSVSQIAISDERAAPLLDFCKENNLPILLHCGRHPISHIKHILETANKYKKVKFITAHMGGNAYDLIEDAIELCKSHSMSNVFVDTSTGRHPNLLRKAIEVIGDERLIFGTDMPYTNMDLNMKYIELSKLSDKEYRNIMGYNVMKRVLNLL